MKIDDISIQASTGLPVLYFDEIDSTNLFCNRKIKKGEPFCGIVVASSQTNGQGRTGKTFYSPKNSGLYLTFCLEKERYLREDLTPIVALALCSAIQKVYDVNCGVKWVNDIYLQDRKVAGILCQLVEDYVLIGVGVNLAKPDSVPEELESRMGWLSDQMAFGQCQDLIMQLYKNICFYLDKCTADIHKEYCEKCVHIGKTVTIEYDNRKLCGTCVGIDDDFSLLVDINGTKQSFTSGYMVLKI